MSDILEQMRTSLDAARASAYGSGSESLHRARAVAYAAASIAEELRTANLIAWFQDDTRVTSGALGDLADRIGTRLGFIPLPQGPAETGTPLAAPPAPAEPDVGAVAQALFRWNTPNDPYFVITGRRVYSPSEEDSYVPIVRAVIEALRVPTPPQGSAAPPTVNGVEASRPSTAETVPAPAEPSLARLDRLEELAGEVRRWREADRLFPCDTTEWWDATLRLRDVVDRLAPMPDGAR